MENPKNSFRKKISAFCTTTLKKHKPTADNPEEIKNIGKMFMNSAESFEKLASSICSLDRTQLIHRITSFKGTVRLDFPEAYLQTLSLERLIHILMAAVITVHKEDHP